MRREDLYTQAQANLEVAKLNLKSAEFLRQALPDLDYDYIHIGVGYEAQHSIKLTCPEPWAVLNTMPSMTLTTWQHHNITYVMPYDNAVRKHPDELLQKFAGFTTEIEFQYPKTVCSVKWWTKLYVEGYEPILVQVENVIDDHPFQLYLREVNFHGPREPSTTVCEYNCKPVKSRETVVTAAGLSYKRFRFLYPADCSTEDILNIGQRNEQKS